MVDTPLVLRVVLDLPSWSAEFAESFSALSMPKFAGEFPYGNLDGARTTWMASFPGELTKWMVRR